MVLMIIELTRYFEKRVRYSKNYCNLNKIYILKLWNNALLVFFTFETIIDDDSNSEKFSAPAKKKELAEIPNK